MNNNTIIIVVDTLRKEHNIMEEMKEILLTQEGYDNLEKELEFLKTEKRKIIKQSIKNYMKKIFLT